MTTTDLVTIGEAAEILKEPAHRIRAEISQSGAYQGQYVEEVKGRVMLSRSHIEWLRDNTLYFSGR